jgi:hypothetical protein
LQQTPGVASRFNSELAFAKDTIPKLFWDDVFQKPILLEGVVSEKLGKKTLGLTLFRRLGML